MIALTRDIGDSLLSLTAKVGGDTPSPAFEPETLAFESRVLSDGGKILDIDKLDRFIKANKSLGLYANLQFAVSKQFGYKLDGSGNIIKIYDASKNGNDLEISRGTVPEDLENEMFFLNNVFFKDETVTFDTIGGKFTFTTDINHPNPDGASIRGILAIGVLNFIAGGSVVRALGIFSNYTDNQTRSSINTFITDNDANILRKLDYRQVEDVAILRKDLSDLGINSNYYNLLQEYPTVGKIVYGGMENEGNAQDADCYLNDSFFYNEYLTDQELEDINDTL